MAKCRVLEGGWVIDGDIVIEDEICKTIQRLISEHLRKITHREGGWTTLFEDPSDHTYWELTYPQSELHGGGPPRLAELNSDEIRRLYPGVLD